MAKDRLIINTEQKEDGVVPVEITDFTVTNLGQNEIITVTENIENITIESVDLNLTSWSILKIEGTTKKRLKLINATGGIIFLNANTGGTNFWTLPTRNETQLKPFTALNFILLYDFYWMLEISSVNSLVDTPRAYANSIFEDYGVVHTRYNNNTAENRLEYLPAFRHYNINVNIGNARFGYNPYTTLYRWVEAEIQNECDSIISVGEPIPDFREILIYNSMDSTNLLIKHNDPPIGFQQTVYGAFDLMQDIDFNLPPKTFMKLISRDGKFTNKIY